MYVFPWTVTILVSIGLVSAHSYPLVLLLGRSTIKTSSGPVVTVFVCCRGPFTTGACFCAQP